MIGQHIIIEQLRADVERLTKLHGRELLERMEAERERLAIIEHFRRRAHVEAPTPLLGRAIGVSKQRADQLARTAIRNLQRYAAGELKGSTAKVSAKIEAASSLRDFA